MKSKSVVLVAGATRTEYDSLRGLCEANDGLSYEAVRKTMTRLGFYIGNGIEIRHMDEVVPLPVVSLPADADKTLEPYRVSKPVIVPLEEEDCNEDLPVEKRNYIPADPRIEAMCKVAVERTRVLNKVRAGKPLDSAEQEVFEKAKCEFEKRGLNIPGL
jgi:hypothetical protein